MLVGGSHASPRPPPTFYKQRQFRRIHPPNPQNSHAKMDKKKYTKQPPAAPTTDAPPHDDNLEEVVLGAMMLESGAELEPMSILKQDSFYKPEHQLIYKAICDLSAASSPIDIYTVIEQLAKNGDLEAVGGAYYVASLTEKVGSAAHLEFHSRIVQQKAIQRTIITIAAELDHRAKDPTADLNDTIIYAEKSIYDLSLGCIKKDVQNADTILAECAKQLQWISENNQNGISGVPSGLTAIDRETGGFQQGDIIIVAARPSMGKTALALSIAKNMVQNFNVPTLIFSLEMTSTQLMNRIISSEGQIPSQKFRTGTLDKADWQQYERSLAALQGIPLYIDDTAAISLFELRSKAIRMKQQHKIGCIIVDYLQLMTTGQRNFSGNREQEVATVSRGLKQVAKELNVPIIVLSQLSRNTTQRATLKPMLSDLRDSGSIEQDADIVMFIHRPEYYGITQTEMGDSTDGLAEIIFAKNRNGATTTVNLKFTKHLTLFSDFDSQIDNNTF